MKRYFSIALIVVFILLLFAGPAMADSLIYTEYISNGVQPELQEHVNDNLLIFNDVISRNCNGNLKMADPIKMYGVEDNRYITFLFDDLSCIGFITTSCINEQLVSSLTIGNYEEVQEYYENNQYIVVIVENVGMESESLSFNVSNNLMLRSAITLQPIELPEVEPLVNYTPYNVSLNVPYVRNTSVDGRGLCWAASVAAISNYRNGTSYTARNIYDALDEAYLGTPVGNTTWYNRAFTYCSLHCTSVSGGLPFLQIVDELFDNNPVIFSMTSNSSDVSHAIVCKSAEGDYDMCIYGFMDPNSSSTTYAYIDNPENPSNFHYTSPGGTVYDEWMYARYSIV